MTRDPGSAREPQEKTAPPKPDRGTVLAEQRTDFAAERTDLALRRTFFATERTLMAWIRTSMSMITFGFSMVKFFQYLAEEQGFALIGPFGRHWGPGTVGSALITIGTLALVIAVVQHRQALHELHRDGLEKRFSLALMVATFVATLGVFALGSAVLRF